MFAKYVIIDHGVDHSGNGKQRKTIPLKPWLEQNGGLRVQLQELT